MKKLSFLLTIMFVSVCSFAQDIIVTKSAKKIDAKILEVSTSEIRYKELDNLDGPIFILRSDEISSIIYANGKVVLYDQPKEEPIDEEKEAEAIAKSNQMGSLFGNSGNNTGASGTRNAGQKGNPVGHGSPGGNSWSLPGRGIKGTLPMPSNNFSQEGKVIVQIRVNPAGKVVEASIVGGNVSDKQTQQLALDAAKKAKFTEGENEQVGTINYIFKLL